MILSMPFHIVSQLYYHISCHTLKLLSESASLTLAVYIRLSFATFLTNHDLNPPQTIGAFVWAYLRRKLIPIDLCQCKDLPRPFGWRIWGSNTLYIISLTVIPLWRLWNSSWEVLIGAYQGVECQRTSNVMNVMHQKEI